MNFQLAITKEGDRYLAGIPGGVYQASATTPLQAMRKWIDAAGIYVQRYKHLEITLDELSQKLGITGRGFRYSRDRNATAASRDSL